MGVQKYLGVMARLTLLTVVRVLWVKLIQRNLANCKCVVYSLCAVYDTLISLPNKEAFKNPIIILCVCVSINEILVPGGMLKKETLKRHYSSPCLTVSLP